MPELSDIARKAAESAARVEKEMLENQAPVPEPTVTPTETVAPPVVPPVAPVPERPKADPAKTLQEYDKSKDNPAVRAFVKYAQDAMDISETELTQLVAGFKEFRESISYSGIIMKCPGTDKCPHYEMCPFQDIGKYPVSKLCPVERMIADKEMAEYFSLIGSQTIDVNNLPMSIINMIISLVECDLTEIRMRSKLHEGGYTRMRKIFNARGDFLTEEEDICKAFEIKERVSRRKDTIMKSLLFTPEIKKKYKVDDGTEKALTPAEALIEAHVALDIKRDQNDKPTSSE